MKISEEEKMYRENVLNQLTAILAQTVKTNGRVSTLEERSNKLDVKIAVIATSIATIIALKFPFVAGLITAL